MTNYEIHIFKLKALLLCSMASLFIQHEYREYLLFV